MQKKSLVFIISFALIAQLFFLVAAETEITAETGTNVQDSVIIQGQAIAVQSATSSATGSTATSTSSASAILKSTEVPETAVSGDLKIEVATEDSTNTKVLRIVSASGVTTTIGVPPQTAITAAEQATGTKCKIIRSSTSTLPASSALSSTRVIRTSTGVCIIIIGVPRTTPLPVPAPTTPPATGAPTPTTTSPKPAASATSTVAVPAGANTQPPRYIVTVPVQRRFFRIFPTTINSRVNVDVTTGKVVSIDESFWVKSGLAA